MNPYPVTVADELAAALLTLLGAINEHNQNGIISKEVAVNLARVALEHYTQSKKESKGS